MAGPFEPTPRSAYSGTHVSISTFRENPRRQTLLLEREKQSAKFTEHAVSLASLTADPSRDVIGRAGARAALRMFCARQAIEQIDDALVRFRGATAIGGYGWGRAAVDRKCESPSSPEHGGSS